MAGPSKDSWYPSAIRIAARKSSISSAISDPKCNFVMPEVQLQYHKAAPVAEPPMGKLKKKFGKRLQQLRIRAGITQEQLADGTGLTVESISNIERGIFGPRFETLEKLSGVLRIPVKELFDFGKD
jgi:DNA-binding XRE family transcriptional regulator